MAVVAGTSHPPHRSRLPGPPPRGMAQARTSEALGNAVGVVRPGHQLVAMRIRRRQHLDQEAVKLGEDVPHCLRLPSMRGKAVETEFHQVVHPRALAPRMPAPTAEINLTAPDLEVLGVLE
ncbi:hypothetical protein E2562_014846 [Oryza meyeriana var. granulata]|uniref:Uncharacterized protein n=1 Tax=Oryza meyeriana var. granulata TaxID=110450 RepID=A0A6G1BX92_9ORYZ|nr:hypothetical protein E2562_014846 [Oryza meyeriana var. granulata]